MYLYLVNEKSKRFQHVDILFQQRGRYLSFSFTQSEPSCHTICEVQPYSLKLHFFFFSSSLSERSHLENVLYLYNQAAPLTISLSDRDLGVIFPLGFRTVLTCLSWHCQDKYCASPLSSGTTHVDLYCISHSCLSWHPASGFVRADKSMQGWDYLIACYVNIHSSFWLIKTVFLKS